MLNLMFHASTGFQLSEASMWRKGEEMNEYLSGDE